MSANHYPLTTPLSLPEIRTLIGIYQGRDENMHGERDCSSRHALYKQQLIEKNRFNEPEVTEKGEAYLIKLSNATSTITLTPQMSRVEWV